MLRCHNFSGMKGEHRIFSDVTFEVGAGELLVVSGKNGAGKSTLLQAIAGLPDISVEGDVGDAVGSFIGLSADGRFKRGIMLLFQDPPALPGVSFLTVAREMLFAQTGERPEIAKIYHDIRVIFSRLGFDESFIERSLFDGFSGGEKKRAELALLLLAKPRIALLDEIDAGLDASGRHIAQMVIGELLEQECAVVCVTHNLDFLVGHASAKRCAL